MNEPARSLFLVVKRLVLQALGIGLVSCHSVDPQAGLKKSQLKMAEYLLAHDGRWPQPGDPNADTWWRTPETARMPGTFEVAPIGPVANLAFYDAKRPWLAYTDPKGSRFEALPDGRVVSR